MNWMVKAAAMNAISHLPGGRPLYGTMQAWRATHTSDHDEMLARAVDLLALYREDGATIAGSAILEIGTGWLPWVPLLLSLAGARQIFSIDINPWLTRESALATTRALQARAGDVATLLELAPPEVDAFVTRLLGASTLDDWLDRARITCSVVPSSGVLPFAARSFDVVLSSNVLEHVEPDALRALHRESRRLLAVNGRIVHRVNPQDHFSTADKTITGANFLRFSETQWRVIGGGLAYHNRLRCRQHVQLIREAGFLVTIERTRRDVRAEAALRSGGIRPHRRFADFTVRELADDYLWVVARTGEPTAG